MNTGNEDFDKLRKLLKLKRHEQPPPGYFSRFSGLVITRLEREGESDGVLTDVPWLKKLIRLFESSPVAAGLFGSALCALAIYGVTIANKPQGAAVVALAPAGGVTDANTVAFSTASHSDIASSTDPVFGSSALASPFVANGSLTPRLENVTFSTSSR
jgi:hypothetical protein